MIEGVTQLTTDAGHAAHDVLSAATNLLRDAEKMRGMVKMFLDGVRAA